MDAARAGEWQKLKLLQTVEGQALFNITNKLQGLAQNAQNSQDPRLIQSYKDSIAAESPKALEAYKKWKAAAYGRALAEQPDVATAIVPGLGKIFVGVPGIASPKAELVKVVNESIPTPGNLLGGAFGFVGDVVVGCATGSCPEGPELANSAIGNFLAPAATQEVSRVIGKVGIEPIVKAGGTAGKVASKIIPASQSSFNLAIDFGMALSQLVAPVGQEWLGIGPTEA